MIDLVLQIALAIVVVYVMGFVTYWKWKLIYRFLMTEEQRQDFVAFNRKIFRGMVWLFGIKHSSK